MNTTNPTMIQRGPANSDRTPLFLLHDGGGTIFQYFLLRPLGRTVYGIQNSRFVSGEGWSDGIPEMAREYLKLIKGVVSSGNILIGGWSLGGLVALEIAHLLANDEKLHISGLVMIDSVYPRPSPDASISTRPYDVVYENHVKPEIRRMVQRSMDQTKVMVKSWRLPEWSQYEKSSESSERDDAMTKPQGLPPPTVLLRASDFVYPESTTGICSIDQYRQKNLLGWEDYPSKNFVNVAPINGHHYSIFVGENIQSVNVELKAACDLLDQEY